MKLAEIRQGWNEAAEDDAMFYILTNPEYEGGKWPAQEFFKRGTVEIDAVMDRLGHLDFPRGRALDFGCGVGRLTQALTNYFDEAVGTDISEGMLEQAREQTTGCTFQRCGATLPFPDDHFDFLYSVITLQHMPRRLQRGYVREFLRVVKPEGLAVFQIPEGPIAEHGLPWLSMYGTDRETVEGWLRGAEILDVEVSEHSGPGWLGYRYAVRPCA